MTDSPTYTGKALIRDLNGILVDVGKADLHPGDPATGEPWGGTIRVFVNAALTSKTMPALLELDDGVTVKALVGPRVGEPEGELSHLRVVGFDTRGPF